MGSGEGGAGCGAEEDPAQSLQRATCENVCVQALPAGPCVCQQPFAASHRLSSKVTLGHWQARSLQQISRRFDLKLEVDWQEEDPGRSSPSEKPSPLLRAKFLQELWLGSVPRVPVHGAGKKGT